MAAMSRLLCICLAVGCVVGYVCTWGATWLWGIATAGPHSISLHLPVEHPLTRPSHVPWHPHAKQSLAGGVFGTDLKQHPLMQSRSRVASYVGDGRGSGWYVSLQGRVERTFGSLMIWVLPMLISLALLRRGLRYCLTSTAAAPQLQEAVLMGTETPTPSVSMSTLTGWAQVPTTTWCLDHEKVLLDGREPAPRTIAELSEFSVTTFNIQAPMYKRLPEGARESEKWHLYIPRNQRILGILLQQQSSAFCLQEFSVLSVELFTMYKTVLTMAGYNIYITPRPHRRGDGLLTAVAGSRFAVLDVVDVPFRDCADRVAHVLHLKGRVRDADEVLLVNTHLMFPHNVHSSAIRLRECAKLLEFLGDYVRQRRLPHVPVVMCGDWNGTSSGCVARFMRAQGFVSAYEARNAEGGRPWVSHLNHHQEAVGVDQVWLLNPSARARRGPLSADWRAIALAEITVQLVLNGCRSARDARRFLAQNAPNADGVLSKESLVRALQAPELGLTGPGSAGLLRHELKELVDVLDGDDDGLVTEEDLRRGLDVEAGRRTLQALDWDVKEYFFRAALAAAPTGPAPPGPPPGDVEIVSASLPRSFGEGVWPEGYQDQISDHAPLRARFRFP